MPCLGRRPCMQVAAAKCILWRMVVTPPSFPPWPQALCMVASYPFYPDQRQLEGAIKDKAGQLWEQLQRAA